MRSTSRQLLTLKRLSNPTRNSSLLRNSISIPPSPSPSPSFHTTLSPLYFRNPIQTSSSSANFSSIRVLSMSTGSPSGDNNTAIAEFALSTSTCLKIQKGDITLWSVDGSSDAIVNAANERMLGGGGVDGAIHRAAGPELKEACYKVPEARPGVRCPTGEARITPGFRLPASHVIHTVGPIYDVDKSPETSLKNAYRNSLLVAKENNIHYIAFPAISCGVYGYPYDEAASIAISTVKGFANDFKEIHFVLFSDDIYNVWLEKAKAIVEK